MSLRSISRWLFAVGCIGALPLYAQTTATTTSSTTSTKSETTHVTHKAKTEAKEARSEEKTETKAEEHHEMKGGHHAMHAAASGHLASDAARLAAILDDSQSKAMISGAAWKVSANEANGLANRVYASARTAGEKKAAHEARTHIREMQAAALKGDADGAKSHAAKALPFVYQVIDSASK